jgi:hypothetical protein
LNRARDCGKDIIRVRADQSDRTDDDQENHGQHDSVLSDVLSGLLGPDEAGASLRWDQPTSTRVDKEEKETAKRCSLKTKRGVPPP